MIIHKLYQLANKIDPKFPKIADKLERLAAPHFDPPSDFQPRTILKQDVPQDAEIMYHATNDLQGVHELGLVSKKERRDWKWPNTMGIGGGTPEYVSLTKDRKIAENIANAMKMLKDIMSVDAPGQAVVRAESWTNTICQENNINFNIVIGAARRMFNRIFSNKRQDPDSTIEELKSGYEIYYKSSFGPKAKDLPEGSEIIRMWDGSDPSTGNVQEWRQPFTREEWTYRVAKYFDYMLDEIENLGGPTSPMFFGYSDETFQFDPNHVGVAEVMVSGEPDRQTQGLQEWAGHPEKTRVILK